MRQDLLDRIAAFSEEELSFLRAKVEAHQQDKISRGAFASPKSIVAYIEPNSLYEKKHLVAFLKNRLPGYMIPSAFVSVPTLPMLPNGKMDRRALENITITVDKEEKSEQAPVSDIEQKLTDIWEEVLQFSPIRPEDNFFEIGGDSILSIQIIAKTKELGFDISPKDLFDNQNIAALANAIGTVTKQDKIVKRHVVTINDKGSKAPLFCIHAGGSHFFYYNLLGKYIEKERSIYAVQSSGIDDQLILHDNIEHLASDFLREIKDVQPEGPYHIMAYCFSTAVALEMAKKLREEGETVNFIVMDTIAINQNRYHSSRLQQRITDFRNRLISNPLNAIGYAVSTRIKRYLIPFYRRNFGTDDQKRVEILSRNSALNYKTYDWEPFEGSITLFLTKKDDATMNPDIIESWKSLSEKLNIEELEGEHGTLFVEPNVKSTSRALQKQIDDFEGK